jgi:hypothetical protein
VETEENGTVFWDVFPCSLVEVYQCFREVYCPNFLAGTGSKRITDTAAAETNSCAVTKVAGSVPNVII